MNRLDRNVAKLVKAGAAASMIDAYVLAEKAGEDWPRAWHRPADDTRPLSPSDALELQRVYGLEMDGHWRDLIQAAKA